MKLTQFRKAGKMFKEAILQMKQGDITAGAIGLTIAAVVVVGVGIPIVTDTIANQSLTGTTALIVGFVPVFMALALLVGAVSLMR